jgi:hypothetical protein
MDLFLLDELFGRGSKRAWTGAHVEDGEDHDDQLNLDVPTVRLGARETLFNENLNFSAAVSNSFFGVPLKLVLLND